MLLECYYRGRSVAEAVAPARRPRGDGEEPDPLRPARPAARPRGDGGGRMTTPRRLRPRARGRRLRPRRAVAGGPGRLRAAPAGLRRPAPRSVRELAGLPGPAGPGAGRDRRPRAAADAGARHAAARARTPGPPVATPPHVGHRRPGRRGRGRRHRRGRRRHARRRRRAARRASRPSAPTTAAARADAAGRRRAGLRLALAHPGRLGHPARPRPAATPRTPRATPTATRRRRRTRCSSPTTDGTTEQVASWKGLPGKTMHLTAATAADAQDIAEVEVRSSDGDGLGPTRRSCRALALTCSRRRRRRVSRLERRQEPVAELVHPPDRRVGRGAQAVLPAPAGDPLHHRRVLGDHARSGRRGRRARR